MPSPRKNEKKEDFISRCIAYVKEEDPNLTKEQAAGKCYGIWKNERDKKKVYGVDEE